MVNFELDGDALCPCDSGQRFRDCCRSPDEYGQKHLQGVNTCPPPPQTGHAHPGCYASCLNDCSEKLSREHFVSESLLEKLNELGGLRVQGLSWMKGGESKALPPSAMASKILCDRHNAALSGLDSLAVRFFGAFSPRMDGTLPPPIFIFLGNDLERWLLKILCGGVKGAGFRPEGRGNSLPKEWIEILFGRREFPLLAGLHVVNYCGHFQKGPYGVLVRGVKAGNNLDGIAVWLTGFELILSMSLLTVLENRPLAYRPERLNIRSDDGTRSIIFAWNGGAERQTLWLRFVKIPPGSNPRRNVY
jgi:hypothetical protein